MLLPFNMYFSQIKQILCCLDIKIEVRYIINMEHFEQLRQCSGKNKCTGSQNCMLEGPACKISS